MTTISQQIQSTNVELALPATGKRTGFAFLLSLATVGTLIFSHGGRPLPFIEWTAAFLFVAISFDLRDRRIPNALNFPALLIAFALAFHTGGGFLLRDSLLGAGLMFAILFPAFALRALGAGDVKALMVLGALWGPDMAIPALVWMASAGALLAIGYVVVRGELGDLGSRWLNTAKLTFLTRQIQYVRPAEGSAAASGIPFALAIGVGAIAFQFSLSSGSDFSW
jgi:prepilin peptidase CpaA